MKLSIVTVVVTIINVSTCSATLNFLSFISNIYESNVKTFWNTLNLKKIDTDASVFDFNDETYNNVIDNDNGLSYPNTNHHYEIFQYTDYDENLIEESDDVFALLSNFESDREFRKSKHDGILKTILKFFGFRTPVPNTKNYSTPIHSSNKTSGLDVRLKSTYFTNLLMDAMESQFKLIYPGTLWCGGGSQARSYDNYGLFRKTDKCCKKHDSCPKYIEAGETWKNLENVGIFTRSHCDCDRAFYTCLKKINSFISNKIGVTYFNLLRPQCFRSEYPVVSCLELRRDNRCFSYIIDDSRRKKWQWFDNKMY